MPNDFRRSLFGVIDSGDWESALFTTFTLSLGFFEGHVLPRLYERGCERVTILVDERFYASALNDAVGQHVGTGYRLYPVSMPRGIFHAKLAYFHGGKKSEDALTVGSGNLTYEGWGGQFECLDVLTPRQEGPAFLDFARILGRLADDACIATKDARNELRAFSKHAEISATYMRTTREPNQAKLISSLEGSVGSMTCAELGSFAPLDSIIVVSPYLDSEAQAVRRLGSRLGAKKLLVAVDEPDGSTPLSQSADGVAFVRRASFKDDRRATHAKWYQFRKASMDWLLTGSANATETSLWSENNFEVASLRAVSPDVLPAWPRTRPAVLRKPTPLIAPSVGLKSLVAAFSDGDSCIDGAFLRPAGSDGSWRAHLEVRGDRIGLPPVVVCDGAFKVHVADKGVANAQSAQLILDRKGERASGWIHFPRQLELTRLEREFVQKVRKLGGDEGELDDFVRVLGWLTDRLNVSQSPRGPTPQPGIPQPIDDGPRRASTHFGETTRIALRALASFSARNSVIVLGPRVENPEGGGRGYVPEGSEESEGETTSIEQTRGELEVALERLQQVVRNRLQDQHENAVAERVLLEALLWVNRLLHRSSGERGSGSLPFAQWLALADDVIERLPRDEAICALSGAAMACAWLFKSEDEPREESFALTAQHCLKVLNGNATTRIGEVLESSPAFRDLTSEQRTDAQNALTVLRNYRGWSHELHDYLRTWHDLRAHRVPADLDHKTGGMLRELERRRGMSPAFMEWTDAVPRRCLPGCYWRFTESERVELKMRRALKCPSCARLHFWTGVTGGAS